MTSQAPSLEVDDRTGTIRSILMDGHELLCDTDPRAAQRVEPDLWHGAFWMVPWVGDNGTTSGVVQPAPQRPASPSHGVVRHGEWRRIHPSMLEWPARPPAVEWPGTQRIRVSWDTSPGSVSLTLRVAAESEPLRLNAGWHPWFQRVRAGEPANLEFPDDAEHRSQGHWLPVDPGAAGRWDTAIRTAGAITMSWPHAALSITSSTGNYLLFDEEPHGICVEPLLAPLDEYVRVPAGGQTQLRINLQYRSGAGRAARGVGDG